MRAHADEYVYPFLVKPFYSHEFKRLFHGKYLRAADFEPTRGGLRRRQSHRLAVVLLEEIPGPDDLLCSYYTYLDEDGEPQFDFTKRVIRRYPEHEGFACYHVTDWNPEVRDLGLRLFEHVGLLGLANVEFKRDPRDGRLKVIEVNARFTAANGLVAAAGYDLGGSSTTGLRGAARRWGTALQEGLHLWYPLDDFVAYLDLRSRGASGSDSGCAAWRTPACCRTSRWTLCHRSSALDRPTLPSSRRRTLRHRGETGARPTSSRGGDGRWTARWPSCTRGRWAAPSARRSWTTAGRW